jgi:hypothetical protein
MDVSRRLPIVPAAGFPSRVDLARLMHRAHPAFLHEVLPS